MNLKTIIFGSLEITHLHRLFHSCLFNNKHRIDKFLLIITGGMYYKKVSTKSVYNFCKDIFELEICILLIKYLHEHYFFWDQLCGFTHNVQEPLAHKTLEFGHNWRKMFYKKVEGLL